MKDRVWHPFKLLRQLAATAAAVGAGLVYTVTRRSEPLVELTAGDPAPDFTLPGSDGRTYRLKDLAGRPVVVAWFPKAFTGG